MNIGKTLFAQLMDFLPWSTFTRIVTRYGGDQRVRTLSCAEHYRAMAFAQLTYRESLRDIETCLSAQASKLYAMGFREGEASVRWGAAPKTNKRPKEAPCSCLTTVAWQATIGEPSGKGKTQPFRRLHGSSSQLMELNAWGYFPHRRFRYGGTGEFRACAQCHNRCLGDACSRWLYAGFLSTFMEDTMPKYRATRFINRREAEHCRFDAVSDDQAKEILTTLNEASEIEWESCEDSDCDPAAYDETLMLEKWSGDWSDATAGWAAVAEEILLPSQMPYSGHAIVFVNKVAALRKEGAYHDAIETLEALIREANKLCGR